MVLQEKAAWFGTQLVQLISTSEETNAEKLRKVKEMCS